MKKLLKMGKIKKSLDISWVNLVLLLAVFISVSIFQIFQENWLSRYCGKLSFINKHNVECITMTMAQLRSPPSTSCFLLCIKTNFYCLPRLHFMSSSFEQFEKWLKFRSWIWSVKWTNRNLPPAKIFSPDRRWYWNCFVVSDGLKAATLFSHQLLAKSQAVKIKKINRSF